METMLATFSSMWAYLYLLSVNMHTVLAMSFAIR